MRFYPKRGFNFLFKPHVWQIIHLSDTSKIADFTGEKETNRVMKFVWTRDSTNLLNLYRKNRKSIKHGIPGLS